MIEKKIGQGCNSCNSGKRVFCRMNHGTALKSHKVEGLVPVSLS